MHSFVVVSLRCPNRSALQDKHGGEDVDQNRFLKVPEQLCGLISPRSTASVGLTGTVETWRPVDQCGSRAV